MRLLPFTLVLLGVLSLACAAPGDADQVECDEGSTEVNGECVPLDVEGACVDYIDAYVDCAVEAYDLDRDDVEFDPSTCDAYEDVTGSEAAETYALLKCIADVYENSDCSDEEDMAEAAEDLEECDDEVGA